MQNQLIIECISDDFTYILRRIEKTYSEYQGHSFSSVYSQFTFINYGTGYIRVRYYLRNAKLNLYMSKIQNNAKYAFFTCILLRNEEAPRIMTCILFSLKQELLHYTLHFFFFFIYLSETAINPVMPPGKVLKLRTTTASGMRSRQCSQFHLS